MLCLSILPQIILINKIRNKNMFKDFKTIPIHLALQRTVISYKLNLLHLHSNSSLLLIRSVQTHWETLVVKLLKFPLNGATEYLHVSDQKLPWNISSKCLLKAGAWQNAKCTSLKQLKQNMASFYSGISTAIPDEENFIIRELQRTISCVT